MMTITPILLAGTLAAGVLLTTGDGLHEQLVKWFHGTGHEQAEAPHEAHGLAGAGDTLHLLHRMVGELDPTEDQLRAIHELFMGHADRLQEHLGDLARVKEDLLRATVALPFDAERVRQLARRQAELDLDLALLSGELHEGMTSLLDGHQSERADLLRAEWLGQAAAGARLHETHFRQLREHHEREAGEHHGHHGDVASHAHGR